MKKYYNIIGEKTPNPDALKFIVENTTLTKVPYQIGRKNAQQSPLAEKLFLFEHITEVFISHNFITLIKQADSEPWENILSQLRILIRKHLEENKPLLNPSAQPIPESAVQDSASKIKALLDKQIRPATRLDGGDITFSSFENGTVEVNLHGACTSCPFAPRTIKQGIETLLKRHFPEVSTVTSKEVDWEKTQQEETPGFNQRKV